MKAKIENRRRKLSYIFEIVKFVIANNLLAAEELGIKEYVPAYLDPYLKPNDLLTGVSFASGASGYDPLTSELMVNISIYIFCLQRRKHIYICV